MDNLLIEELKERIIRLETAFRELRKLLLCLPDYILSLQVCPTDDFGRGSFKSGVEEAIPYE